VSVAEAVEKDLKELGDLPAGASALAASALALASEMDSDANSATSKSMCAKALLETMDRLRAVVPDKRRDRLDDLAGRREMRLRRSA
jgi:hypothetical protein